jgi:hypothetical protein
MKLQDIYKRKVTEELNPVVSVSDYTPDTVKTEINEYVFTDEIIHYLYMVLNAIREGNYHQNGIWINGYFGTGKSHFLKYLNYCFMSEYRDQALARLEDAVLERDPLTHPESHSDVYPADMRALKEWLKNTEIKTVLFNIGDKVTGDKRDEDASFTKAIWQEFNKFRGYNRENIALAQYLEKPLAEKGKFEDFKRLMDEEGFDWEHDCLQLAATEIDFVMEIAKQAEPSLSYDTIRENIKTNNISLSVENLTAELNHYIKSCGDNYRLLFFIDEISMFIGGKRQLLLQLQQIVVRIQEDCSGKVWLGCTAQQDLSELVDSIQVQNTADDYGQIKGRFPVRVALKGANTEFVTKKRVLGKEDAAVQVIGKLYDHNRDAISNQFNLPTSYNGFSDKEDFISYYPFVPYQFQLLIQVFDSFVTKQFVDKEVKGNERSVLKITHNTVYNTRDEEVGKFISFDQFYSAMFEAGLQPKGRRARRNADSVIVKYQDVDFGKRVVDVLYMICNISENDQMLFPATIDNVVTLLMTDIDQNRLELKQKVERVLEFLKQESIIRLILGKDGAPDTWQFYSEDESEVASLIANRRPDNYFMAEQFNKIFNSYLSFSNKEGYCGSNFSVSLSILGRTFFGTNTDIQVELVMQADTDDASNYAFTFNKDARRLVFFMAPGYKDRQLVNDFYWYCQVEDYLQHATNESEQRTKTNNAFREQAAEIKKNRIEKPLREIFDNCQVIGGQNVFTSAELDMKKGNEKYKAALQAHLAEIYKYAKAVSTPEYPTNAADLRQKLLNPQVEAEMSMPEQVVENFLNQQGHDTAVTDVVQKFSQAPYGWNEFCTLYVLNKLVVRRKRAFMYNNNPNVDRKTIAENLQKNKPLFTVTTAQEIPQDMVNKFTAAWKNIFKMVQVMPSDAQELFDFCRLGDKSPILHNNYEGNARKLSEAGAGLLAQTLYDMLDKMKQWRETRDIKAFFSIFIDGEQEIAQQIDNCTRINGFCQDQLSKYADILSYVNHNEGNFEFLGTDERQLASELKKIQSEAWPIDKMPVYNKQKRNVEGAIGEVREKMVDEVKTAYNECYAQLEQLTKNLGIPEYRLPDKEATVSTKTRTESLHALKLYADTSEFFNQQVEKINKYAEEKNKPKVVSVNLITRSKTIRSEADVDAYLADLKKQIMAKINGKDDVIIQ